MVNTREYFWMFFGALLISIIAILIFLTIIYQNFFLLFSGVLTFYSLIIAIVLFIVKELIDRKDSKQVQFEILAALSQHKDLIRDQLDPFSQELNKGMSPYYNMSYFPMDWYQFWLDEKIEGKTTSHLKKNIFLANDKIDALNEIRNQLWDLTWNSHENKKKFLTGIKEIVETATNELKLILKDIEKNLKAWKIN